jgi:hypothetical protein
MQARRPLREAAPPSGARALELANSIPSELPRFISWRGGYFMSGGRFNDHGS